MQLFQYDAEVIDEMIRKITHTEYTFISDLYEKISQDESKGACTVRDSTCIFTIIPRSDDFYVSSI